MHGLVAQSSFAIRTGVTCTFTLVHPPVCFVAMLVELLMCLRQSGTVNSSLTVRPKERRWAIFRWCASQGPALQMRHCEATKARWALLRLRAGFVNGATMAMVVDNGQCSSRFAEGFASGG
jgi:hypothetical protein